jgi:hypothetical protein
MLRLLSRMPILTSLTGLMSLHVVMLLQAPAVGEFELNQQRKRECRRAYLGDVAVAFQLCPLPGAAAL